MYAVGRMVLRATSEYDMEADASERLRGLEQRVEALESAEAERLRTAAKAKRVAIWSRVAIFALLLLVYFFYLKSLGGLI